ncbi:MAG: dTMP kinase [Saprospirales bacterium]|nr:MAG: dTMP kinase [Saprospirales bacterium]
MEERGKFIALEGIDGSGKSSQVKALTHKMKEAGLPVYPTFEPTAGPVGSLIRNIFSGRIEADQRTIAGLFVADRLDHLLNKTDGIIQKINSGCHVLTDRYFFSSLAYQGAHVDMDWVIQANSQSVKLLRPNLHIFLDLKPEKSIERLKSDRRSTDMYEKLETLQKVRQNFFTAFEKMPGENVVIIDGARPFEEVSLAIWEEVSRLF